MELKKAVKETRKKTLEDAKIFMSWLYSGENLEEINNLEKSFLEELKLMTGDCVGIVEIFAEFDDGTKGSGRAYLRDIVSSGIELPGDIANFYVNLKVLRSDKSERNIMGNYNQHIFTSDVFYIKENIKTNIDGKDGIVINSIDEFSSMSGNNIRFKTNETVIEI